MARRRAIPNRRVIRPRRNRRRISVRRLIKPLLLMLAIGGIVYGAWVILTLPSLAISDIQVTGAKLVDAKAVQQDAWHALRSEKGLITRHHNILAFPKRRMAAYLSRHREIRTVAIGRVLPGTLVVRVQERIPVAVVTDGSTRWLMDSSGTIFHRANADSPAEVAIHLPRGSLSADGRCFAKKAVASSLQCLAACREAKLQTGEISVDHGGNVCFNMSSDFYVKLGQPTDMQAKLGTVAEMLGREPDMGRRVRYIDVSCKEFPVVRPRTQ